VDRKEYHEKKLIQIHVTVLPERLTGQGYFGYYYMKGKNEDEEAK